MPDAVDDVAEEVSPDGLPDDVLVYTLLSRYCLPDVLGDEAWSRFGSVSPGYRRVRRICSHVHEHLTFRYGSSTTMSTAADVNASGFGVCRDFAHLAISFCRALNIPARYVFGYLPDLDVDAASEPMDFAAWMEVWLAGRWWTFDPRNDSPRKGRVPIGRGRDAADVAMATAFGGPHLERMSVTAEECVRPDWPPGMLSPFWTVWATWPCADRRGGQRRAFSSGRHVLLRLRWKSSSSPAEAIDGGWWPRSMGSRAECPAMIAGVTETAGVGWSLDQTSRERTAVRGETSFAMSRSRPPAVDSIRARLCR